MSTTPLIRIERGNPTTEDLAALSTALLTRRHTTATTPPTPRPLPAPWHRTAHTHTHNPHAHPATPPNPRTNP
ncbi:acyl-CoA carboxylase subunit epsilon [Streptomyces aculeolatus]